MHRQPLHRQHNAGSGAVRGRRAASDWLPHAGAPSGASQTISHESDIASRPTWQQFLQLSDRLDRASAASSWWQQDSARSCCAGDSTRLLSMAGTSDTAARLPSARMLSSSRVQAASWITVLCWLPIMPRMAARCGASRQAAWGCSLGLAEQRHTLRPSMLCLPCPRVNLPCCRCYILPCLAGCRQPR